MPLRADRRLCMGLDGLKLGHLKIVRRHAGVGMVPVDPPDTVPTRAHARTRRARHIARGARGQMGASNLLGVLQMQRMHIAAPSCV